MGAVDYIIVGGGSAGCAAAAALVEASAASVTLLEAGPADGDIRVKVPMGLIWLMGSSLDWQRRSTPQAGLDGRSVKIPRGRLLGGSGSINSMVWFRGRRSDYDAWDLPGWRAGDLDAVFEAVEARVAPIPLPHPHPLSRALGALPGIAAGPLTPERESAGPFEVNMRRGRRWSAADAFLRPHLKTGRVQLRPRSEVRRLTFDGRRVTGVELSSGRRIAAARGVLLAAGAIESPAILLRSGLGPAETLRALEIPVVADLPGVGANLHDHPAIPIHHAGPASGYGLVPGQLPAWLAAGARYALAASGPLTSNTVEAGAFLRLSPGAGPPEAQVHFIPFRIGWEGRAIGYGAGYTADICLCQPRSRGGLTLNPDGTPSIDLGLFADPADMALMVTAFRRLRRLLAEAPFGRRRAPEVFPGPAVESDDAIAAHIRARAGTAYHPVGTVRMGTDAAAPLTPALALRGIGGLWVGDASIMPRITSANTNAPAMAIGWRAGTLLAQQDQTERAVA